MILDIGPGLSFDVLGLPKPLSQPVCRFFSHFVHDESYGGPSTVPIIVKNGSPPEHEQARVIIDEPPLRISATHSGLIFELPGITCFTQASGGQIWIEDLNLVPVDHFSSWMLVAVLFELAIPHGFLGLHAAAFNTRSGAVVLPGASGSGKTTIFDQARSSGLEVISDDLVWVHQGDTQFRAIAFPRRDRDSYDSTRDQLPIIALVLPAITQHSPSRLCSIEPSRAVQRLMEQGSFFLGSPSAEAHFCAFVQLANAAPCFTLDVGPQRDGFDLLNSAFHEKSSARFT